MKEKLESNLISIAQRILTLGENTDIDLLCDEVHNLYEKLLILKFVNNNLFITTDKPKKILVENHPIQEEIEPEITEEPKTILDDFAKNKYADTVFEKVEEPIPTTENKPSFAPVNIPDKKKTVTVEEVAPKVTSLNDKLSKRINIDLNDRIAFIKHLFGNSSEDYNRVMNNIFTFETFDEVDVFINEIVRPTYNNWEDKDEYVDRFMNIIEKKFSNV